MAENGSQKPEFDWRLTSFEGSRREELRRWAQLPLENILLAIEEMQAIADTLRAAPAGESGDLQNVRASKNAPARDGTKRAAKRRRR